MAQFDIFIDTNRQVPVRSFVDSTIVPLPPLIQGDTPTLRIWPLVQTPNFQQSQTPYAYLGTAGLSLEVALGTRVGNSSMLYTQQFTWPPDANGQSFTAQFPLNTAAVTTLLDINSSAQAWFEVKYLSGGLPSTILEQSVQVQAAVIKPGVLVVPPGQTALSAEEANANFLKRLIHGVIILQNDNTGKQIAIYVADDGSFHADPVN